MEDVDSSSEKIDEVLDERGLLFCSEPPEYLVESV
jgi:hypothetical protein